MNNDYIEEYKNNMIDLLNQYLANIAVLTNKIYNFHWNIVGPTFFCMHLKLEEYYKKTEEIFDEVAELIKQLEGFPITSLREYVDVSQISEVPSKEYNYKDINVSLINDFDYIILISKHIIQYAERMKDNIIADQFNEYEKYLTKQIWMLKSTLK